MCARYLGASLCCQPTRACLTALQCVAAEEKGAQSVACSVTVHVTYKRCTQHYAYHGLLETWMK